MAFVKLICTARSIQHHHHNLIEEKKICLAEAKGDRVKYKFHQLYQHYCANLQKRLRKCCAFPRGSYMHKKCFNLRHAGSYENFYLKSFAGFIGGFCLTYVFFMFFVFQLNFKLSTATIMCAIFGSILTIGLAFSFKVRCVVFLLLPQFFSKRGRQALMAYAFILAITGPAKNTLNNMGILSESLACGQEQLKSAVKQILEVIKKPFLAIKDAIKAVVKTVKEVIKKIKEILLAIKRIIMSIVKVIKAAFQFLAKIISICNKELGTPFDRCTRVFEDAISDCHAKLGPLFDWLCSVAYLTKHICYIVKVFDFVCMIVDFISDSIIGVVIRKIKTFIRHIRTMFYVRIKFSHSFHFETKQSKSMNEIAAGIVTEIKERSEGLMKIFDFMSGATSLFFMFIIFRVLHYRYKFLTNERFDNKFITNDFRLIDLKRAQHSKETVLPLNHRERNLYISVSSLRLVKQEKVKLSQSAVVLLTATMKLSTHMIADYSLYWVLSLIRLHGRFQSKIPEPKIPTLNIEGKGLLADLLRSIVKAFQPVGIQLDIDTVPCLPEPIPPDFDRYVQIATLLVLCWFLTIFEPYGLRFRHSVMCYYHPFRAKERAVWLYNHIMRSRSSFLKFARRQLKRKFTGTKSITKITFKEYLRDNLGCWWLRCCLGPDKQICCILCGEVFRESDKIKPIRCQTPSCPGIYCEQCFNDIQNLCTVCLDPIQYGDLSDISEEKDSSSDATNVQPSTKNKKKKTKKKKKQSSLTNNLNTDDDNDDHPDDGRNALLIPTPLHQADSDNDDHPDDGINALLIPTPLHQADSDYFSTEEDTGVSTDYSYTYQDNKDIASVASFPPQSSFVDLEKQRIPEYASMESYHEDRYPPIDMQSTSSYITDYESFIILKKPSDIDETVRVDITPEKERKPQSYRESFSTSQSSYITELQNLTDEELIIKTHDYGTNLDDVTSLVLTTDNEIEDIPSVPQLDLSFLDGEQKPSCICINPECTKNPCTCKKSKFDDIVKMDIVNETDRDKTSPSTNMTYVTESKSIVNILRVDSTSDRYKPFGLRRRYIKGSSSETSSDSSNSESDSSNFLHYLYDKKISPRNSEASTNISEMYNLRYNKKYPEESIRNLSVIDEVTTTTTSSTDSTIMEASKSTFNTLRERRGKMNILKDSTSSSTSTHTSTSAPTSIYISTSTSTSTRTTSRTTSRTSSYNDRAKAYYKDLRTRDMTLYMASIKKADKSLFGFLREGFKR